MGFISTIFNFFIILVYIIFSFISPFLTKVMLSHHFHCLYIYSSHSGNPLIYFPYHHIHCVIITPFSLVTLYFVLHIIIFIVYTLSFLVTIYFHFNMSYTVYLYFLLYFLTRLLRDFSTTYKLTSPPFTCFFLSNIIMLILFSSSFVWGN